jgi:triosephosphate isomerase
MKYIIGNWKSNKNTTEVKAWTDKVGASGILKKTASVQAVLCPSFMHIPTIHYLLPDLTLGAQTLSPYPNGAYTGAVSALIATEYVRFAILGHAERRKYFNETNQTVAQEVIQAIENDITPIVAVDKGNWSSQLVQFDDAQIKKLIVMYEPAEAISTSDHGHAADLEEVKQSLQLIKAEYPIKAGLYGGSVNSKNIQTYLSEKEIDGVVPGAASLDADEFIAMIAAAV